MVRAWITRCSHHLKLTLWLNIECYIFQKTPLCHSHIIIKFLRNSNVCITVYHKWCQRKLINIFFNAGQSGSIGAYNYPQAPEYPVKEIIIFDPPFDEKPQMMYGLNFIDVNYAENFRVNSSLVYIDKFQAILQMSTWHDTKLYGVGLSWMACP